tara:strand:- start:61568 stop:62449 length:882 start_codon:yes stop_codon:yes gene_type:complete
MSDHEGSYHVPKSSAIPIISAIGLFFFGLGSIDIFDDPKHGIIYMSIGAVILVLNMIVWFRTAMKESRDGLHDAQMQRTYQWGMIWYFVAQSAFALAFLGGMAYIRIFTVPWLGGHGPSEFQLTHLLIWPDFQGVWPVLVNPANHEFVGAKAALDPWTFPLICTITMLISIISMVWARVSYSKQQKWGLVGGLAVTFVAAIFFAVVHVFGLLHAIYYYKLTLASGIYGSLFFMINITFCLNLLIGTIFLAVVLYRALLGRFSLANQFSVRAVSEVWYFVAILWIVIFLYVYLF